MTDLEISRLCAEAMGLKDVEVRKKEMNFGGNGVPDRIVDAGVYYETKTPWKCIGRLYDPLHDDAQVMALVKKLRLMCGWDADRNEFFCEESKTAVQESDDPSESSTNVYLNRAICECGAKMQKAKAA